VSLNKSLIVSLLPWNWPRVAGIKISRKKGRAYGGIHSMSSWQSVSRLGTDKNWRSCDGFCCLYLIAKYSVLMTRISISNAALWRWRHAFPAVDGQCGVFKHDWWLEHQLSFVSVLNLLQLVSFSVQFFLSFFFSLSRSCYVSGPCPCLVAVNEISLVSSVFFFFLGSSFLFMFGSCCRRWCRMSPWAAVAPTDSWTVSCSSAASSSSSLGW